MMRMKLHAQREPWMGGISFLLVDYRYPDRKSYATDITMHTPDKDSDAGVGVGIRPTFTLDYDAAQFLMDELWNCGLRPSEGTGSAGALAAVEKHLAAEMEIRRELLSKVLRSET